MTDRARMLAASQAEAQQLGAQPVSEVTPSRRDFAQYVATQKADLAVIARLTAATPQLDTAELIAHARACDDAEVAALAVATAAGGLSIEDMAAIAAATTAPILRDVLTIDRNQIYFARLHGADALVFPAAALPGAALHELVEVASSLHMGAVIEVLNVADLAAALALPHAIIGLQCALANGTVDVTRTQELARDIPRQRTVLALPEVDSAATSAALHGVCDAVVAGALLLASDDLEGTLRQLAAG